MGSEGEENRKGRGREKERKGKLGGWGRKSSYWELYTPLECKKMWEGKLGSTNVYILNCVCI